jgi:hypothetical protein
LRSYSCRGKGGKEERPDGEIGEEKKKLITYKEKMKVWGVHRASGITPFMPSELHSADALFSAELFEPPTGHASLGDGVGVFSDH